MLVFVQHSLVFFLLFLSFLKLFIVSFFVILLTFLFLLSIVVVVVAINEMKAKKEKAGECKR